VTLINQTETSLSSTTSPAYKAFLSHNSSDKAAVEKIAIRLQDERNLRVFLDKWHLIPGDPLQEELEKALDQSETCVIFLGPSGLGPWQNEEMRVALDERLNNGKFRVIPVLLPSAKPFDRNSLPPFLRRLLWVDFRNGLDNNEEFGRLVAGICGYQPGRYEFDKVEPLKQWVMVISGTVDDFDKPKIEAMAEHLRQISGDLKLTINEIKMGSIKLIIESTDSGREKIASLLKSETLSDLMGHDIVGIEELQDQTTSLLTGKKASDDTRKGMKLYVGNLSFDTSASDLEQLFATVGTVESTNIIEDRETGRSRGFGFVEMSSKEEGQKAISDLNGKEVGGRALKINEAKPQEKRTGGGGGYGGGGGSRGGRGGGGGYGGGGGGRY
jgi:hypothetical protein